MWSLTTPSHYFFLGGGVSFINGKAHYGHVHIVVLN